MDSSQLMWQYVLSYFRTMVYRIRLTITVSKATTRQWRGQTLWALQAGLCFKGPATCMVAQVKQYLTGNWWPLSSSPSSGLLVPTYDGDDTTETSDATMARNILDASGHYFPKGTKADDKPFGSPLPWHHGQVITVFLQNDEEPNCVI